MSTPARVFWREFTMQPGEERAVPFTALEPCVWQRFALLPAPACDEFTVRLRLNGAPVRGSEQELPAGIFSPLVIWPVNALAELAAGDVCEATIRRWPQCTGPARVQVAFYMVRKRAASPEPPSASPAAPGSTFERSEAGGEPPITSVEAGGQGQIG